MGGDVTDEALLAGIAVGDSDAALLFVRRFQARVYGLALTITADSGLAEDIAQRAFERAWRHAGAFDPRRGQVAAWLTTITRNLAIDVLRARRPIPVDPERLTTIIASMVDDPEARALRADADGRLQAAIRALPAEQGRAVVMASLYGMTCEEVARADGIPVGTVKSRVRAAVRKLREALETADGDVTWTG